jgi:hypothetical protein
LFKGAFSTAQFVGCDIEHVDDCNDVEGSISVAYFEALSQQLSGECGKPHLN